METTTRPEPRRGALRANLALLWLARHWLRVALTLLGIYVTLPFVAPTLMKAGLEGPARVIYTLYSPFCHQFAFRTFFLYGEQAFYPRAIVPSDLTPYESYILENPEFDAAIAPYLPPDRTVDDLDLRAFPPAFQLGSRAFLGNEQMGYKMTICARDISIYIAMFLGGLIYSIPVVRRRLRPVPLYIYVILGIGPIAVDGFSQLLGYPPFNLWTPRETTPYFRVITGALFGLMNVWLGFPYFEMSMRDTVRQLEAKLVRAGIKA